jgi:holin-like protein
MIGALFVLLGFELIGEVIRAILHLPVPGPVLGMLLLALLLITRDRGRSADQIEQVPAASLDTVAGQLIANMGLMFVPAGVGVIAEAHLLRSQWPPILGGLVGSTILSLVVTGLIMHHATRERALKPLGSAQPEMESLL